MATWHGPGSPFAALFEDESDDGRAGTSLPAPVRELYGDWRLPTFPDRPYVYANFVISHDGRASFGALGALGGGAVSGFNRHDQWLMGLLRARADALHPQPDPHRQPVRGLPAPQSVSVILRADADPDTVGGADAGLQFSSRTLGYCAVRGFAHAPAIELEQPMATIEGSESWVRCPR